MNITQAELKKIIAQAVKQSREQEQLENIPKEKITKTKTKNKQKKIIEKPKTPYTEIPQIIKSMKIEENISRFGILWNSKNPYNITNNAVIKFFNDYNIISKKPYFSYAIKDLIDDKQLENKPSKIIKENTNKRIIYIRNQLKSANLMNGNINFKQHRIDSLTKNLNRLTNNG